MCARTSARTVRCRASRAWHATRQRPMSWRGFCTAQDLVETAAELIAFCDGLLVGASALRDLCARKPSSGSTSIMPNARKLSRRGSSNASLKGGSQRLLRTEKPAEKPAEAQEQTETEEPAEKTEVQEPAEKPAGRRAGQEGGRSWSSPRCVALRGETVQRGQARRLKALALI